jgi:Spy/CpxP family protein refolding chaperone
MKKLGKIQTLAAASLAAIALATPLALAQTPGSEQGDQQVSRADRRWHGKGHVGRHGGRMGGAMMFKGLNLTDNQKAQMKEIGQSYRERNKPLREQLRAKRQELRQANEGGTFNEALATQKLTEAASLQAKLMGEQFKLRQEMLAVLTPEQKAQLEQKREEFKARRAEHGARQRQ